MTSFQPGDLVLVAFPYAGSTQANSDRVVGSFSVTISGRDRAGQGMALV